MKYTGYMLQHFLKSINRPRTKHKICIEGDKLQEGLFFLSFTLGTDDLLINFTQ